MLRILCEMEKLSTLTGKYYNEPAYREELEREYPNYRVSQLTGVSKSRNQIVFCNILSPALRIHY